MRSRPRSASSSGMQDGGPAGVDQEGRPTGARSLRSGEPDDGGWGGWRWWIAAVLLVAAVGFGASRVMGDPDLPDFVPAGDGVAVPAAGELPAVTLEQFEGMLVGLRGQPVVLNVWASWCAPCRTEMPMLQDAAEASPGRRRCWAWHRTTTSSGARVPR